MRKRGFLRKKQGQASFVGCLHLLPLPGSPGWEGTLKPVIDRCEADARAYVDAGAHGLILENTHDIPYLRAEADPATVAAMASVATRLREQYPAVPIGIQVLAAADFAALEIAVACDLDFIRVEGFNYAHVADEGIIQANAGRLLRRRAHLRGEHIAVFADIKKKHSSHALTGDLSLVEFARGVLYNQPDGVIVTGGTTGQPPELEDLVQLREFDTLLAVGSGIDAQNISEFARYADLLIVGTACKFDGDWRNEVEPARVQALLSSL